jgi:hypothetical protein
VFVQVIEARTNDPKGFRRQAAKWEQEVRPGAVGFLGTTGGVADDGRVIVLARFADEASARKNSERPEQGTWWEGMAALLEGEATFRESSDVTLLFDGGSDRAGFVQIMHGTVDRAKAESFETPAMMDELRAARPDLIGAMRVWFAGGAFVEAAYFTSEADARRGESSEAFAGPQQEYMALFSEMAFTDLRDPILVAP